MPPTFTNGPSDSTANTALNASQPPGGGWRAFHAAQAIVSNATHARLAAFSTDPFGRSLSHVNHDAGAQGWSGLGIAYARRSIPGELLRHSGDGFAANGDPRGEVNADSMGASPTRIAAMPTIENRAVAQVRGRADTRGRLVPAHRSMSNTDSSSIGVYSRVMLTVIPRSTNRRPPESATATMS